MVHEHPSIRHSLRRSNDKSRRRGCEGPAHNAVRRGACGHQRRCVLAPRAAGRRRAEHEHGAIGAKVRRSEEDRQAIRRDAHRGSDIATVA